MCVVLFGSLKVWLRFGYGVPTPVHTCDWLIQAFLSASMVPPFFTPYEGGTTGLAAVSFWSVGRGGRIGRKSRIRGGNFVAGLGGLEPVSLPKGSYVKQCGEVFE